MGGLIATNTQAPVHIGKCRVGVCMVIMMCVLYAAHCFVGWHRWDNPADTFSNSLVEYLLVMENTELRFHVGAHPEHPRGSVVVYELSYRCDWISAAHRADNRDDRPGDMRRW